MGKKTLNRNHPMSCRLEGGGNVWEGFLGVDKVKKGKGEIVTRRT
jgi:hypothetical protein